MGLKKKTNEEQHPPGCRPGDRMIWTNSKVVWSNHQLTCLFSLSITFIFQNSFCFSLKKGWWWWTVGGSRDETERRPNIISTSKPGRRRKIIKNYLTPTDSRKDQVTSKLSLPFFTIIFLFYFFHLLLFFIIILIDTHHFRWIAPGDIFNLYFKTKNTILKMNHLFEKLSKLPGNWCDKDRFRIGSSAKSLAQIDTHAHLRLCASTRLEPARKGGGRRPKVRFTIELFFCFICFSHPTKNKRGYTFVTREMMIRYVRKRARNSI